MSRVAPAALLAALALVAATGCGGGGKDASRKQVNAYIRQVDSAETGAAAAWKRAQSAYSALGGGKVSAKELRRLAAAPATIRSLRARIAALDPPPAAAHLHSAMLRLLDADAGFADELSTYARYVTAAGPVENALAAETNALRHGLAKAKGAAAQRRELENYAARLGPVLARMQALRPSAALAPWQREQLARVRGLRAGALELAHGLAAKDRTAALAGLSTLSGAAGRSGVTQADRAAVVDYDRRLARIRTLTVAVAKEQQRLVGELS